jgi:hypothetical protein
MSRGVVRKSRKQPETELLDEKVSFPEFLEVYNISVGQVTPPHHKVMAHWLVDTSTQPQRLLQAFRESGKSCVCLFIAWRLYGTRTTPSL